MGQRGNKEDDEVKGTQDCGNPKLKQTGSRVKNVEIDDHRQRRRGICGPFELESDAGNTRPKAFQVE